MGKKTPDDHARELLLTDGEREAHAVAVQALLAGNASMRANYELIEEELGADPEFRVEWERTVVGRALALAIIRYRAERDLSQRELAERLGVTRLEVEDIERGDVDPPRDTVERVASRLGIGCPTDGPPSRRAPASAVRRSTRGRTIKRRGSAPALEGGAVSSPRA